MTVQNRTSDDHNAGSTDLDDVSRRLSMPVDFYCRCSEKGFVAKLDSLPLATLEELEEDGTPLELLCHFCNENYSIQTDTVAELVQKRKQTSPEAQG